MSVKRYELTDNGVEVFSDGRYVLHSDYAALLARHNALVEAVAWERECDACPLKNKTEAEKRGFSTIWATRRAARAEVDRLLGEGKG